MTKKSKLKITLKWIALGLAGSALTIIVFLKSLNPEMLIVGALDHAYHLPQPIFKVYIKQFSDFDPNSLTEDGVPFLHFVINGCAKNFASESNCREIFEHLVNKGALVNAVDKTGLSAAHLAVLYADPVLLALLKDYNADLNLPAQGQKYQGMTPLRFAKELKSPENYDALQTVVKSLIEFGGHE